jgi:hypothetical protein
MHTEFERVRTHIASRIAEWTADQELCETAIPGLSLYRHAEVGGPVSCMVGSAIALPVQGAKRAQFGSESYAYDSQRFLITLLDLPEIRIKAKTREAPGANLDQSSSRSI